LTFYISNIKKFYKNDALYLSKKFVYFYEWAMKFKKIKYDRQLFLTAALIKKP